MYEKAVISKLGIADGNDVPLKATTKIKIPLDAAVATDVDNAKIQIKVTKLLGGDNVVQIRVGGVKRQIDAGNETIIDVLVGKIDAGKADIEISVQGSGGNQADFELQVMHGTAIVGHAKKITWTKV